MCRSVLKGYLHGWIPLEVFWGVCTCSNSIYTTIPMPLYSCLVSPVSWNLKFIITLILVRVFTEKEAGTQSLVLYFHWNSLWCGWSLWILLLLPAVLLNTSWDNAMLCSRYKKHLFFRRLLVLRLYRNSNGVKNYGGDFIPMFWKLLFCFFFCFSCPFRLTYASPTAACLLVFSRFLFC